MSVLAAMVKVPAGGWGMLAAPQPTMATTMISAAAQAQKPGFFGKTWFLVLTCGLYPW
jgi:hypothetical protein